MKNTKNTKKKKPNRTEEEKRSYTMSRIGSKDTKIEILLRKALWHRGIRYRKNYRLLPGAPDIAITKHNIAIFCDGEFWHGKDWKEKKESIHSNREFWIPKIERNMQRDEKVDAKLGGLGWAVVRFWGMDIQKNLDWCVETVEEIIFDAKLNRIETYNPYYESNQLYKEAGHTMETMEITEQKPIFELGEAPTPSCHASTIASHGGILYAAWFGGTAEGADDVGIWLSQKVGELWGKPVKMSESGDTPHWNPVLFSLEDQLFLYYKKGKPIPRWQTFYRVLENGIWKSEAELVPGDVGGRGPVKNKPVRLKNGTILAPASLESEKERPGQNSWNAFIDISEDGIAWRAQRPIEADANLIQPTIWETDEGVHALMRSDAGAVYRSDSADGGKTWRAYRTDLPNNNSGLDAVCTDGALYLVYNPVGENWGPRTPLVVSKSEDNGKTWAETITLEDAEGEYSYPSVIAADGSLHIVYTHRRKNIMYAEVRI